MKLSHSKLNCILSCPMTYYLNYILGIQKKTTKPALTIGSAVHWGIEHNTDDLTDFFGDEYTNYSKEQLLSEAMIHGYFKHKDEIFKQILNGRQLLDEQHEVYITGKIKSYAYPESTEFVGIIDLLLLTNDGFIVIDYKTSTFEPNWSDYTDQLYRYIELLKCEFPDIPVVKIGIINIRKSGIRQKKAENSQEFLNRLKFEYDINDENYVNYHEFDPETLNKQHMQDYVNNLGKMCDMARMIDEKQLWYINYGNAVGQYGKSDYWDIFYHTPDAELLYSISDHIWDENTEKMLDRRDCKPVDMLVCDSKHLVNKYSIYSEILHNCKDNEKEAYDFIKANYKQNEYDEDLIKLYQLTYEHDKNFS